MTAVDTDGDVYAGDTAREITVTYTAIGQIVGGSLKVTVPADWADAMAGNPSASSGSVTRGGDLSEPHWRKTKISAVSMNSLSVVST